MLRKLSKGYAVMHIRDSYDHYLIIANTKSEEVAIGYDNGDFEDANFYEEVEVGSISETYKAYKSMILEYVSESKDENGVSYFTFDPTTNDRLHAYAFMLNKVFKNKYTAVFTETEGTNVISSITVFVSDKDNLDPYLKAMEDEEYEEYLDYIS